LDDNLLQANSRNPENKAEGEVVLKTLHFHCNLRIGAIS